MKGQNIYDCPEFFDGYRELRSTHRNYNDLLEQPAMAKRLPDLNGRSVLDLGCGFGKNCADFVRRGARCVVGVDLSEKMLSVARKEHSLPQIRYLRGDLNDLSSLREGPFDLVYSSLAFHYVLDFGKLMAQVFSLLKPGGWLLFSQEHPLITATVADGDRFHCDPTGEPVSYEFSDYSLPGRRTVHWFVEGVEKFHRPMGELLTSVAEAGFVIRSVTEPLPDEEAQKMLPALRKERIRPNFLIVCARRPG